MNKLDARVARMLNTMAHSPVRNYATAGLTSWLIGGGDKGTVRLFSSDRDTREWITPHSHRFDFVCVVLEGQVENILYHPSSADSGNVFCAGTLKRIGVGLGRYVCEPGVEASLWVEEPAIYNPGDVYRMWHKEVHSIRFSKNAQVLFFEGPERTDTSVFLEPWSNGQRVPTFETRSWMFQSDDGDDL